MGQDRTVLEVQPHDQIVVSADRELTSVPLLYYEFRRRVGLIAVKSYVVKDFIYYNAP
jgi:hypothetical protein